MGMDDEELKRLLETTASVMRRHFDATTERSDLRFDQLAEAVAVVNEKLDRRAGHLDQAIDRGFSETQA